MQSVEEKKDKHKTGGKIKKMGIYQVEDDTAAEEDPPVPTGEVAEDVASVAFTTLRGSRINGQTLLPTCTATFIGRWGGQSTLQCYAIVP